MRPVHARRSLRPELALTTCSWIAALLLLALNDHVLKQAGVLPGWLTGKLSDFAGLYVAPALLATLVRARSDRALALCHVSVGAGFAAINLDAGCADGCVRALSALGVHWRVVSDAADLIALPALLASYHWLGATMARDGEVARAKRRAQHALAVVGLALCTATSNEWQDRISSAGPHLHNPTGDTITVLVRNLRASVLLDCAAVAEDPGRMLPDSAFEPALAFELDPHENLGTMRPSAASVGADDACGAVLVSGTRLSPAMLFWRSGEIPGGAPFTYEHEKDWQTGAIVLQPGHAGLDGYRSIGGDFVFAIERATDDVKESCALPSPAQRPAISIENVALGTRTLLDASEGADGCLALRFGPAPATVPHGSLDADAGNDADGGTAAVDDPADLPEPPPVDVSDVPATYLCIPQGMFPFQRGDVIKIEASTGGMRWTSLPSFGRASVELDLAVLERNTFVAHLDIEVKPRSDCDYQVRAGCAETAKPAEVEVRAGSGTSGVVTLHGGEGLQRVSTNGFEIEFAVPFAQWRAVLDSECAEAAVGKLLPMTPEAYLIAVVRQAPGEEP